VDVVPGYVNPIALDSMAARSTIHDPRFESLERVTLSCNERRHERCTPQAYSVG
jgi:hypothetical protein